MSNIRTTILTIVWRLKIAFRRIMPMRWRRVGSREPISAIALLQKPHLLSLQEVQLAAERAWNLSFACGGNSTRAVSQSDQWILLRAGPHLMSVYCSGEPYAESPGNDTRWLSTDSQKSAWAKHSAFTMLQYVKPETDVELAHCVLAKLLVELVDDNCLGVYLPSEAALLPAEKALVEDLKRMASYRKSDLARET